MVKKTIFLLIILSLALQVRAQISLNELKAAYIEKFTKFIEWPDSTWENNQTFVIGYYKFDDFIEEMELFFADKLLQEKYVEFLFIKSAKQAQDCDLIYLPKLSKKAQKNICLPLKDKPILLMGHTKEYAEHGVHINFYLDKGKLKFEINPESLKNSGLKTSYLLLKLAKIVKLEEGNV